MFVGSGMGTIAAIASQQAVYSAAPVSALLLLNLLNHRRLERTAQATTDTAIAQLDQKFAATVTTLQQQVQSLPSPLHLASLRKDLQNRQQESVADLERRLRQLSEMANRPEVRSLPEEVLQLREQYTILMHSLGNVREGLNRLNQATPSTALETDLAQLKADLAALKRNLPTTIPTEALGRYRELEEQIKHLNRRLNKLPAPFDGNFLKQDIESLIKLVGDLVTRRDLARVEAQVERLTQKNEGIEQTLSSQKTVTTILKKEMTVVASKLGALEEQLDALPSAPVAPTGLETLVATVNSLEQQVSQLPQPTDLVNLRAEVQQLVTGHVGQLQHHLETVQQQTQALEAQHHTLRDWVHQLPQMLDATTLQTEVKHLANRVEWAESSVLELQAQRQGDRAPGPQAELVVEVQAAVHPELGRDRPPTPLKSSRALLEAALETAQARLIVVSPFPDPAILDADMLQRFHAFLARQGCLDIGWGHLAPSGDRGEPRSIDRRRGIHPAQDDFLYTTLNCLTELKKQYPNQFRFKVMGTEEAFLVCDRAYAILGSTSVPTASTDFPAAAIGIRTTDSAVIQQLVARFDNPVLATTDAPAYFHRAATRYDLGDRQGAIADYTELLRILPNHDIAYTNRGLARYDLGEKGAAIQDFERALQHNPHNYIAAFNRGYVRSELGDKLGAIEDYTTAIHSNPDYAPAYFYRGLARTRMQNKLGAIQDYSEVIRLNPNDAGAYFYRGLASAKIGQRMEAIRDLRQAAQLFAAQDDQANYEQALAALKKLQKTMIIGSTSQPLLSNEA